MREHGDTEWQSQETDQGQGKHGLRRTAGTELGSQGIGGLEGRLGAHETGSVGRNWNHGEDVTVLNDGRGNGCLLYTSHTPPLM